MTHHKQTPNEFDKPARLLVVDDDVPSRKLLGGLLLNAGYDVALACGGPEAIEMAQAKPPDVVLLDVMMPQMSGYQVCEILKNDPRTRLCQVMLVTALDGSPDRVAGLDLGADDFVTKPVRAEEFLAKVRALLRVRRLLRELDTARAELACRNHELEMKKMLAQTLVHDLKNPLAGVLGNLDLMEMPGVKDVGKLIQCSRRGAHRMLQMVSDLIDVEALEREQLRPQSERVDLAELTVQALDDAKAIGHARHVTVRCQHVATCRIDGDPALLRRLIDNLVANAVEHSPSGGVVSMTAQPVNGGVEWTISDQGPGIPEPLRKQLFDKYAQAELQRHGVMANRGLGLTFCSMVAQAHRGEIAVETAPSGGTLMRVRMKGVAPEFATRQVQAAVALNV